MTRKESQKIKSILYKWGNSAYLLSFELEEADRIRQIIDSMTDISALVYSNIPKDKSGYKTSAVEDRVIKSIEMCEKRLDRINKRIEEYIREQKMVSSIIDQLDFEKQFIIKGRYENNDSWQDLRNKYPCNMSMRTFYRLHNEALEEIWIIYNSYIR